MSRISATKRHALRSQAILGLGLAGAAVVFSTVPSPAAQRDRRPTHGSAPPSTIVVSSPVKPEALVFSGEAPARNSTAKRGRYVLPLEKRLLSFAQLALPHHDYPAWDALVPIGTPVFAVHSGTVTRVLSRGRCGSGVVIAGSDGFTYTFCHGSTVLVKAGENVLAGDVIMTSGNSGRTTTPHLHLQIQNPFGVLVCPQPLLAAWYEGVQISPLDAPTTGCFFETMGRRRHMRMYRLVRVPAVVQTATLSQPAPGTQSYETTEEAAQEETSASSPSPSSNPSPQQGQSPPSPSPSQEPAASPSPSETPEDDPTP